MAAPSRQALFSGTETPAEHLKLDTDILEQYLADTLPGFSGPVSVVKFRGGQSNPTYKISTPKANYVLRKKPPGNLVKSAHAVDREFRIISALHKQGFPVPEPYFLCEDESILGTAFYLVEHLDGQLFWEVDLPGLSVDERQAIYDSVNSNLAKLHSYNFEALGLAGFGRPGNFIRRQFDRWSKQYKASEVEDIADMDYLIKTLPDQIPDSENTTLVHGDYGLHNIIIHRTKPEVLGVLDWEISTIGDPLVDLSHHLTAWYLPPDPVNASVSSLLGVDLVKLGIPSAEDYINRYLQRTGIQDFDRRFYIAFALFRYAAMIQGVMKRAQAGTGANRNMLHTQERVGILARAARDILDKT